SKESLLGPVNCYHATLATMEADAQMILIARRTDPHANSAKRLERELAKRNHFAGKRLAERCPGIETDCFDEEADQLHRELERARMRMGGAFDEMARWSVLHKACGDEIDCGSARYWGKELVVDPSKVAYKRSQPKPVAAAKPAAVAPVAAKPAPEKAASPAPVISPSPSPVPSPSPSSAPSAVPVVGVTQAPPVGAIPLPPGVTPPVVQPPQIKPGLSPILSQVDLSPEAQNHAREQAMAGDAGAQAELYAGRVIQRYPNGPAQKFLAELSMRMASVYKEPTPEQIQGLITWMQEGLKNLQADPSVAGQDEMAALSNALSGMSQDVQGAKSLWDLIPAMKQHGELFKTDFYAWRQQLEAAAPGSTVGFPREIDHLLKNF
ncbi:MAG: hypothetical protein ACXWPM_09905, partial [Bdellovibrionota bacterium]